jgi:hypothetical protein
MDSDDQLAVEALAEQGPLRVDRQIPTDVLAQWIGKKLAVLEQLRDLARRQIDLIADGDIQRLLGLLAAKQTLLSELQRIQRQLDPFREEDPDTRQWRTAGDRQHCRRQAERCEALLREIMLVEKQSEIEMAGRRDTVVTRLGQARCSAEAARAYIGASDSAPRHGQLDITSET